MFLPAGRQIECNDPVYDVTILKGSIGELSFTAHWTLPYRVLTDPVTGISVFGHIRSDAVMTVSSLMLHDTDCESCNVIRHWMNNGDYLLLFDKDISLSQDFSGMLTLTIPLDARYNGKEITIVHCASGELNTYNTTVFDGKAVLDVTGLSPFAVFIDVDLPTVETTSVSDISATSAKLIGNVIDDGGAAVTERGFVLSKSQIS